jgi:tRNA G10  N-methylase Trm11
VKPIALDKWLATLLLPPAEYGPRRLLNPFCGSGSEAIGAYQAGWEVIYGIEMETDYARIARSRLDYYADPLRAMRLVQELEPQALVTLPMFSGIEGS